MEVRHPHWQKALSECLFFFQCPEYTAGTSESAQAGRPRVGQGHCPDSLGADAPVFVCLGHPTTLQGPISLTSLSCV